MAFKSHAKCRNELCTRQWIEMELIAYSNWIVPHRTAMEKTCPQSIWCVSRFVRSKMEKSLCVGAFKPISLFIWRNASNPIIISIGSRTRLSRLNSNPKIKIEMKTHAHAPHIPFIIDIYIFVHFYCQNFYLWYESKKQIKTTIPLLHKYRSTVVLVNSLISQALNSSAAFHLRNRMSAPPKV